MSTTSRSETRAPRTPPGRVLAVVAVCLLLFVLGVTSVGLAPARSSVAAWWPAAGVGAAFIALSPARRWPVLLVLLAIVTGASNAVGGRPWDVSVLFGLGNAVEALVVASALGAHRARPTLAGMVDLRRLVAAALLGAAVAGLVAAATVAWLLDAELLVTWRTVLASHAAAILVVLPVALLAPARPWRPWGAWWSRLRGAASTPEALAQAALTALAFVLVFAGDTELPLAFVPLPLLIWAAVRLSPWAAALEMLLVSVLVTLLTNSGQGPFAVVGDIGPRDSGALVQLYVAVCVATILPLVMAVEQRRQALVDVTASGATLARERDLTAAVLDTTDSLIAVVGRDGQVLRVNGAIERLTLRAGDDLVGTPYDGSLLTVDARSWFRAALARTDGSPPVDPTECTWLGPGGAPRDVMTSARLLWPDDPASPLVVTGRDVTEQRRTQGLLTHVLDATVETALIGCAPDGTITFFNGGAERMLGCRSEEVVGRCTPARFHDETEIAARAVELGLEPGFEVFVHVTSSTGEPERRDWTYVRSDGSRITASLTITAMTDSRGAVHGFLGVAEDVTEQRQAELALRTALEHEQDAVLRLHELDRIKSDFVASTSHELRTPLTSVLGFAQLLLTESVGPVNERQAGLLGRIEKSGRRLLSLIENLLTLSSIESGELELRSAQVDLRQVVRHALEQVEELLRARDLTLDVLPREPGPVMVHGDEEHLERAVANLLSNAIKFTPDGGRVEVEVDEVGDEARVRVTDTGMGIEAAEQDQLFQRFFRASTATEAAIPGTGLGLAIVRAIIDAHNGEVSVSSVPGAGTTFVVSLPAEA